MRDGGHDAYWPAFSIVAIVAATVLGLRAVVRLGRLGRQRPRPTGGSVDRPGDPTTPPRATADSWSGLWLPLFALVAVAFAIQENVEHLVGHGHLIGLGALVGPEYPLALPVIGLVTPRRRGDRQPRPLADRRPRGAPRPPAPRRPATVASPPAGRRRGWAIVAAIRLHALWLVRLDAGRAPPLVA